MYGGSNYNHSHHPHHHYPSHYAKGAPAGGLPPVSPESAHATEIFEHFIVATTFKSVLHHYKLLCDVLRIRPTNIANFYPKLKGKIRSWKAQAIWTKFDKRIAHKCYNHGKACDDTKVLIIGCGPCGLRAAIEAQLLGAKVVVVEKRDRFSRNNVLHLWPFVIADLKALGAKKFYGKFCAGAIDHISIRQLQCILLKIALLIGVEVFEGVTFEELLDPPEDQSQKIGWHARFSPPEHPVNQYEFDVLISADGKRNTLMGFKRKEFRGKLAIAITANFINKHTEQEARVQEISGVAFIFNQKFFKDLYAATGIDLENIVYYKDETHYFVMTAKKHSLIDKGVILRDLPDTQQLLHPNNVDRLALCDYAREAADFSTGYLMPHLEFAVNHYGKPDIAMFDFTSMFAAENACRVVEKHGHKLLKCLVGDSLLEPFWPTGSGCARGFLSSFDACWATRLWALNKANPLEVIAERESIYRLLAQTTPENLSKDYSSYTLEPSSRYPTVNLKVLLPFQVRHLFTTDEPDSVDVATDGPLDLLKSASADELPKKRKRKDSVIQPETLLSWCKKQVMQHPDIEVENLSTSFQDGRVLCAIINRYRPDLIDFESLDPENEAQNNQLALDILEKEFGIVPVLTGAELSADSVTKPCLISFISQIHDSFRGEIPQFMGSKPPLKSLKGQDMDHLDLDDFPTHSKISMDAESSYTGSSTSSPSATTKISCRMLEEPKLNVASQETLQQIKKRRGDVESMDKLQLDDFENPPRTAFGDSSDKFSDRIRGLEAKFKGDSVLTTQQKPKDMIRAVGRLERTDWNLCAIEKKIEDNPKPHTSKSEKERVPKWSKDIYNDKFQNIERRLRENGEDEERIAKYLDIDASLQRLERKLREGSTLETGLRGHNKVSNLASQLSSKLVRKADDKAVAVPRQARAMVLPSSTSDLCYFCGTRVYLVERLSAEGKFFHRQCFKCSYCGALLRLGNYIYDREQRFGGKFFCIPHFGLTMRSRGQKRSEEAMHINDRIPTLQSDSYYGRSIIGISSREKSTSPAAKMDSNDKISKLLTPQLVKVVSPLSDRGTTPERVEFENSVIEHSDEEEYLSEEEWTDRNFGASANELDDDDDDDSDYSDLSDEEIDEEVLESPHQLTADETRRLAETWKRRYSNDVLEGSDHESLSDSEIDDLSEEHGADGDESHTATEGDVGEGEEEEEIENDKDKRARELRRLEFNINVEAPPKAETSDSGSETEVASEEDSDTEIDTDSEFEEDHVSPRKHKEIPTIVIDELPVDASASIGNEEQIIEERVTEKEYKNKINERLQEIPKKEYIEQIVDLGQSSEGAEKSTSMNSLVQSKEENPRMEQLKRLLHRTESTEAVTAYKSSLRRQYLLGNSSNIPKKSVSSADLGDRFKSFMDKISETQKKLNPAPEPSPAMQAFLNSSSMSSLSSSSPSRSIAFVSQKYVPSGSSPILPQVSVSGLISPNLVNGNDSLSLANEFNDPPIHSPTEESSDTSKSEEGKLFSFSDDNKKAVNVLSIVKPSQMPSALMNDKVPSENKLAKTLIDEANIKNIDINLVDEHSFPVHLEEETEDIICIDAKNICMIESLIPNTSKDNLGNINDILSTNNVFRDSKFILSDALNKSSTDEKIGDIISCEIVSNKNNKNVSNDSIVLEDIDTLTNCSDIDIDECFDKLANDAMLEVNDLDPVIVPLNNSLDFNFQSNKPDKLICEPLSPIDFSNSKAKNSIEVVNPETSKKIDVNWDYFKENDKPSSDNWKSDDFGKYEFLKDNDVTNCESLVSEIVDKNFNLKSNAMEDAHGLKKQETVEDVNENIFSQSIDVQLASVELNVELMSQVEKDTLEIQSPETAGLTEYDLSDWAEDIEVISFEGEEVRDALTEVSKKEGISTIKNLNLSKIRARIASLESLEDSDSAVSVNVCPNVSMSGPTPKPSVFNEIEQNIDYMDTSGSESSEEDNTNPIPFSYKKLLDDTPATTPILDGPEVSVNLLGYISKISPDFISKDENPLVNFKSKSLESDEVIEDSILRLVSEPQVLKEISLEDNLIKTNTPKRYEGYIPRFKDRTTPFSLVRDSIDVRKCSTSKPLFTPSKEDILQRQKNEKLAQNVSSSFESSESSLNSPCLNNSSTASLLLTNSTPYVSSFSNSTSKSSASSSPVTSPVNSSSKFSDKVSSALNYGANSSKSNGPKPKDGDVVKEMVMSRLTKRALDKSNRKGSKNALHLSFNSSTSSLFGSEPSLSKGSITPVSADCNLSNKENKFSFVSENSNNIESKGPLNSSTVPSMSNRSMIDLSAKSLNSDSEVVSPRNILPATPLTHPEKFQRDQQIKKELFKSTPHLPSSTPNRPSSTLASSPQLPTRNPNLNNNNSNSSVKSSIEESQCLVQFRAQSKSPLPRVKNTNEYEHGSKVSKSAIDSSVHDKPYSMEKPKKDPEERLKELLAERKRKESEDQREVRLRNKDSCLQECLEEYRLKRNSAPVPQGFSVLEDQALIGGKVTSPNKSDLGAKKRHFHRPSLLELESMQVFSSHSRAPAVDYPRKELAPPFTPKILEAPATADVMPESINSVSNTSNPSPVLNISPIQTYNAATSAKSTEEVPKKSTKKSKDRERRRSLIQVFAGMFSKSDDKKKPSEENDIKANVNNSSLTVPLSPVALVPPKSPTVKERFSKLRLSRSKDKRKSKDDGKNRSASAEIPVGNNEDNLPSSLSLPTSPSRTIFSFLSSPSTGADRTKHSASGPSCIQSGQLYRSSCIKEENGSEDEVSIHGQAAAGANFSKEIYPCNATPSTKRQKAILRAAKQAEQKRLRTAQEIQRRLEECEVMTRELEERGIKIEKSLIDETDVTCRDEPFLMKEWFGLVREKNELIRWQEELMIKAKELELEDRHVRLESELRQRMSCSEHEKTREDIDREGRILSEIISVIEEKDALVTQLEEERKRYAEEDKELKALEARKILQQRSFQKETGV